MTDSTAHDIGCVGVRVGGGNWTTLAKGSNLVDNNSVTRFSRWKRTYMPGLQWGGVANNYTRNNVSHGPHNGSELIHKDQLDSVAGISI